MLLTKKQRNRPKTIPRPPTGSEVIKFHVPIPALFDEASCHQDNVIIEEESDLTEQPTQCAVWNEMLMKGVKVNNE